MATPTTPLAAFAPVTIGTTPAGQVWTARKAADVPVITARLEQLWTRHSAKTAAHASDKADTVAANQRVVDAASKLTNSGRGNTRRAYCTAWGIRG